MYIDSKPVSLYARTQDWKMPSPQPRDSSSVKRPPILKNGSSSSSLRGMEQSVPSFQTFIKRTPPPDHLKPLPPTPLHPHQRASSFDSGISQCPSSSGRRSSSVYSRTVSQWDPEWDSQPEEVPEVPPLPDRRSADFADQDNNLLLRPIAYSASTSQLLEKTQQQHQQPVSQPQLLEPRAYRPLIVTPSPTASASPSRATTPSPRPSSDSRPSILLPPPPASAQVPKKHLRTVSLEKAQELIQAPGAVHLLPEELRAQQTLTRKTTRSQEPMRMASLEVFDAATVPSPELPASSASVLPTLIDEYGRERLLASPRESRVPLFSYEMPSPPIPPAGEWKGAGFPFHVSERFEGGRGRAVSREKVVQIPRFDQRSEDRGRARIRGSRTLSYGNYIPSPGRGRESRIGEGEEYEDRLAKDEALRIAQDYHILLKEEQQEQYRPPSSSPAASRGSEPDDVRVQMKMVPQPLFHAKPWSGTPFRRGSADNNSSPSRSSDRAESELTSPSPFHLRSGSGASMSSSRGSSDGHGSFPLRLSTTPPPRPSRGSSTSGTIPISPPFATDLPKKMSVASAKALPLAKKKIRKERAGRTRGDNGGANRVSMYYPHVMSRRTKKEGRKKEGGGKEKKKKGKEAKQEEVSPGVPLLAADIVAQRLETPETTPEASLRSDSASGRSAVVEEKPTLHQLVLKGAARYAEKLTGSAKQAAGPASSVSASTAFTKPQYQYTHDEPSADLHRIASPESPHLLPSPSSGKPPPIHLGWSAQSKSSFDRIRSPTAPHSPKHRQRVKDLPAAQSITHIQTPARPMNERIAGLKEELSASETGGGNGGNNGTKPAGILGGLMESWRESKAEKRREDLRKMIRVVTPAGVDVGGGGGGADRRLQELRRGSVGGGGGGGREDGVQRPVGQMQRRLSAFNWM